jgi:predicted enzyme related to lactoylglutathione lyase
MAKKREERGIDYIEFSVTNVTESKAFYGTVFGWKFTDYGPDYASFSDGRLDGGFAAVRKVKAGGPLIVIYAKDLKSIQKAVKAAGGTICKPIFSFPGGRRFHFRDPSGNELAVWSDS